MTREEAEEVLCLHGEEGLRQERAGGNEDKVSSSLTSHLERLVDGAKGTAPD